MVTDEELTEISYKIDDLLVDLAKTHNIEPLNLSSIIIARLIRMNESANCDDHFYQLLTQVSNWTKKAENRTLQ